MADEITITMPKNQARLLVALAAIAMVNLIITGQILGPILVCVAVAMILLDRQRASAQIRTEAVIESNLF